jgi:hypothetical protein
MVECNFLVDKNACIIQECNICDGDNCIFQQILRAVKPYKYVCIRCGKKYVDNPGKCENAFCLTDSISEIKE